MDNKSENDVESENYENKKLEEQIGKSETGQEEATNENSNSTTDEQENDEGTAYTVIKVKLLNSEQSATPKDQEYRISNLDDKIGDLRSRISERNEVSGERIRMIFRGHVLKDDDTFRHYKIENLSVIHCVVRPTNAPPPTTSENEAPTPSGNAAFRSLDELIHHVSGGQDDASTTIEFSTFMGPNGEAFVTNAPMSARRGLLRPPVRACPHQLTFGPVPTVHPSNNRVSWWCNRCLRNFNTPETHQCQICDFHLCDSCFAERNQTENARNIQPAETLQRVRSMSLGPNEGATRPAQPAPAQAPPRTQPGPAAERRRESSGQDAFNLLNALFGASRPMPVTATAGPSNNSSSNRPRVRRRRGLTTLTCMLPQFRYSLNSRDKIDDERRTRHKLPFHIPGFMNSWRFGVISAMEMPSIGDLAFRQQIYELLQDLESSRTVPPSGLLNSRSSLHRHSDLLMEFSRALQLLSTQTMSLAIAYPEFGSSVPFQGQISPHVRRVAKSIFSLSAAGLSVSQFLEGGSLEEEE